MIQREIKHLHPLVANWLDSNGYVYKREVKMPEYGRADFVAVDSNNCKLIIECKVEMKRHSRESILQLLGYCHQLGENVRGAIATVDTNFTEHAINLCDFYDVDLILINASKYQSSINLELFKNKNIEIFNSLLDIWWSRLGEDRLSERSEKFMHRDKLFYLLLSMIQKVQTKYATYYNHIDELNLEEYILLAMAAQVLIELHPYRNSYGIAELSEDIDDVRPIIDAARPEIQKVFSKKPRRLSTSEKPKLID